LKWKREKGHREDDYSGSELLCTQRGFGNFTTRVCIPKNVDPSQLKTHFKEGMLRIEVPYKCERTKKLEIHGE